MDENFLNDYYEYSDMVYRICLIYLKNVEEAEDGVQDIFIKLFKSKKTFESKDHKKAWLIVVSKNYCKNKLANWWKRKRNDLDKIKEPSYKDKDNFIWEEILKLEKEYRLPVYLYYYEGYNSKEIGKILGENDSTIRSRLARAREILEYKLKGWDYEG